MSPDDLIADDVRQYGRSIITINDSEPPLAYTVGLMFTYQHPELIIFGQRKTGAAIIRSTVELIRSGQRFDVPGEYDDILVSAKAAMRPVHPTQHEFYLGFAMGYCRNQGRQGELQAIQIFWPDKHGLFPFQLGCDDRAFAAQPRIDQPLGPFEIAERRREIGI